MKSEPYTKYQRKSGGLTIFRNENLPSEQSTSSNVTFDLSKTEILSLRDDNLLSTTALDTDAETVETILRPWRILVFCEEPWKITKLWRLYFHVLKPKSQLGCAICLFFIFLAVGSGAMALFNLISEFLQRTNPPLSISTSPTLLY